MWPELAELDQGLTSAGSRWRSEPLAEVYGEFGCRRESATPARHRLPPAMESQLDTWPRMAQDMRTVRAGTRYVVAPILAAGVLAKA